MIQKYNDAISLITNGETPYLLPNAFEKYDNCLAFFSTKLGGVSRKHLYSLNLGLNLGDERENVLENYDRIAAALKLDSKDFVAPKQVHELNVYRVSADDKGNGITLPNKFLSADGLVTNDKNLFLTVYGADCVGLLFYDPVQKAVGTAHAGWKGTVYNIAKVVVDKLHDEFGSRPENLIVCIGPSICPTCYEVSSDVSKIFEGKYADAYEKTYEVNELYKQNTLLKKGNDEHSYVNLWLANYVNLTDALVKAENIHLTGLCTRCHSDLLYSHRATGGKRGVQAGFIGLV